MWNMWIFNERVLLLIDQIRCDNCGIYYTMINQTHECKQKDIDKWRDSDEFELMVHREIFDTGTSNWYDTEGVNNYKEHIKNDKDCKFCKVLKY